MNIFDPSTWSPEARQAAVDIAKVAFVFVVALITKDSNGCKAIQK